MVVGTISDMDQYPTRHRHHRYRRSSWLGGDEMRTRVVFFREIYAHDGWLRLPESFNDPSTARAIRITRKHTERRTVKVTTTEEVIY
jgi:hypothetical protein